MPFVPVLQVLYALRFARRAAVTFRRMRGRKEPRGSGGELHDDRPTTQTRTAGALDGCANRPRTHARARADVAALRPWTTPHRTLSAAEPAPITRVSPPGATRAYYGPPITACANLSPWGLPYESPPRLHRALKDDPERRPAIDVCPLGERLCAARDCSIVGTIDLLGYPTRVCPAEDALATAFCTTTPAALSESPPLLVAATRSLPRLSGFPRAEASCWWRTACSDTLPTERGAFPNGYGPPPRRPATIRARLARGRAPYLRATTRPTSPKAVPDARLRRTSLTPEDSTGLQAARPLATPFAAPTPPDDEAHERAAPQAVGVVDVMWTTKTRSSLASEHHTPSAIRPRLEVRVLDQIAADPHARD